MLEAAKTILAPTDEIGLENTGAGALKVGLVKLVVDVVAGGVTLGAGESKTVLASELGDVTQNHFLNVTNASGVDGSIRVVI